ncbi:AraC-like DNA-binding protein [Pedobacter sp. AK017]|uniref:helix-turn-helix domain-containing protein n=1 Tax=Pedobacter sp. AK017 TaxID=2723073 RepID=UPI0016081DFE|nr:AraC family transcriptional regulator [Pedobacter sp. AK017]MBB5437701.1 AraC-like DNA-binding protein [Pedobacter sp. AK017]
METKNQHNIILFSSLTGEFTHDPFVSEHWLVFIISGFSEVFSPEGVISHPPGTLALVRKNQLVKTVKKADGEKPFKSISICIDQQTLKNFSAEYDIKADGIYLGEPNLQIENDEFMKAYFNSLMPYFQQPDRLTSILAQTKTKELIEILLGNPALRNFLFDFSEPYKIDLEAYMNRYFSYNVPIPQFAKLTGRSISSFKRDFTKTFNATPERWLQKRRLEMAYFLISQKKKKPTEVYLEVGFENLSHFSTAFKREFGVNASFV